MALTLTESWVRRISVGFRPLLESSSIVSISQLILRGPFPHTKAAKDLPTCQPRPSSFLPNCSSKPKGWPDRRIYANTGISDMWESPRSILGSR